MNRCFLLPISLGGLLCLNSLHAQTSSSTPPIGFIRKDCPANSDTRVSIPLERQSVFIGPIASISGTLITSQGNPGWTVDEFKFNASSQPDTFYVLFLSGAKRGHDYKVTGNGANTLTVQSAEGDDLVGVQAGDRIKLLPYWNLDQAFPEGDGVDISSNPLKPQTELLMQDTEATGINFASKETFYYSGGWNKVGTGFGGTEGSKVLPPHRFMVVRNKENATSPVFVGVVPSDYQSAPLRVPAGNSNAKQDNPVALNRPVPVSLRDSGLIESGGFAVSTNPLKPTDQLLVFDDTEIGKNKSSVATYYYYDGHWSKVGPSFGTDVGDDVIFTPGTGVIIRKAGVNAGSEQRIFWSHQDPTN